MIAKFLGAVLILTGCGGFGLMICISYRREEEMLRQMIHAMEYIQCELQFRMTPLPELCTQAGASCKGRVGQFWNLLSEILAQQSSPDVMGCVAEAKKCTGPFPPRIDMVLDILSMSLGQFDAEGQLQALESARRRCRTELEAMGENRDTRLRSYQTLGICAGVALVILLV